MILMCHQSVLLKPYQPLRPTLASRYEKSMELIRGTTLFTSFQPFVSHEWWIEQADSNGISSADCHLVGVVSYKKHSPMMLFRVKIVSTLPVLPYVFTLTFDNID